MSLGMFQHATSPGSRKHPSFRGLRHYTGWLMVSDGIFFVPGGMYKIPLGSRPAFHRCTWLAIMFVARAPTHTRAYLRPRDLVPWNSTNGLTCITFRERENFNAIKWKNETMQTRVCVRAVSGTSAILFSTAVRKRRWPARKICEKLKATN